MIVARTSDGYRFVTQPAHAELAGAFAAHWGAGGFDPPDPFAAVVLAATAHDDGWLPYDRRPRLASDGTPENFTALDASTWIPIYDRGIDQAEAIDPYAGLLVSLHGTGLRRRRYGLSPDWPASPAAFDDFVDRHEARQRRLLVDLLDDRDDRISTADEALLVSLHENGMPTEMEASRLWTNYRLLQAWDTLSLACCTTVSPPGRETVQGVPRRTDGSTTSLSLSQGSDGAVVIDPYPFDVAPLVLQLPSRSVVRGPFESESELATTYHAADRVSVTLEFRPPR